jgi:hypothetical protein
MHQEVEEWGSQQLLKQARAHVLVCRPSWAVGCFGLCCRVVVVSRATPSALLYDCVLRQFCATRIRLASGIVMAHLLVAIHSQIVPCDLMLQDYTRSLSLPGECGGTMGE